VAKFQETTRVAIFCAGISRNVPGESMKNGIPAAVIASATLLCNVAPVSAQQTVAQAPTRPRPGPGVALADAKRMVEIIANDPAKLKAWCEMTVKVVDLHADPVELMQALDPDYIKTMDEMEQLDFDSPERKAIDALFLQLGRSCPKE
jgi:hypothetical protein